MEARVTQRNTSFSGGFCVLHSVWKGTSKVNPGQRDGVGQRKWVERQSVGQCLSGGDREGVGSACFWPKFTPIANHSLTSDFL